MFGSLHFPVSFFQEADPELFSSFSRAMFAMFQVCTGDGWSLMAHRLFKLMSPKENEDDRQLVVPGVAVFFASFHIIVGWTLLQVVVAVLLDNFSSASMSEKVRMALEREKLNKDDTLSPDVLVLDPLLGALSHFGSHRELTEHIQTLFRILDIDDSKSISYNELKAGLRALKLRPRIILSKDDFDILTQGQKLLNAQGELGPREFEALFRFQINLYVQRFLASNCTRACQENHITGTILCSLKFFLQQVHMMSGDRLWGTNLNEWRLDNVDDRLSLDDFVTGSIDGYESGHIQAKADEGKKIEASAGISETNIDSQHSGKGESGATMTAFALEIKGLPWPMGSNETTRSSCDNPPALQKRGTCSNSHPTRALASTGKSL